MNFKNDLVFGQNFELELINILKPTQYKISKGCFKPYDIKICEGSKTLYYEVKSDRYTHTTGNVCIEYLCSNQPSGIQTTISNFYAYFVVKPDDKYDLYIIPTDYIIDLINKKKYHKNISGGDNYRAKFYLFKIELFEKFLHKLQ
jgi:hypothetical protein